MSIAIDKSKLPLTTISLGRSDKNIKSEKFSTPPSGQNKKYGVYNNNI
jgi:hypothetical protein